MEKKSAKISPDSHKWIMENKGELTVANVIDKLKDFFIEKNLPRPENPEYIFFKCNKCKEIIKIPGIWSQQVVPTIEQILTVMKYTIPHKKLSESCDGELYFYNVPIRPILSDPNVKKKDCYKIGALDGRTIVIKKIIDKNRIHNYFVGYLDNPYKDHFIFLGLNLQDIYRNIEIIGKRNRTEPLQKTLGQILEIGLKDIEKMKKIFEYNQIIPEGMFKEICLYIPAFRWTQSNATNKYGKRTFYGDGVFIQNVNDIIEGTIDHIEAYKRFKT